MNRLHIVSAIVTVNVLFQSRFILQLLLTKLLKTVTAGRVNEDEHRLKLQGRLHIVSAVVAVNVLFQSVSNSLYCN